MSSVLEAFYFSFESGAKKTKQETEELNKTLDKTEKQTEKNTESTGELSKELNNLASSAKAAILGYIGLGVLGNQIFGAIQSADSLGKFSDSLNLNIEDVGAWGEAVIHSGGSLDGLKGTVAGLTDQLIGLSRGEGGQLSETLARLGLSAFDASGNIKTALDLLPEVAGSFEKISNAEAVNLGKMLGIDQGTIQALQLGKIGVEELVRKQKELGVTTAEDAKRAADFNDAWFDLTKNIKNFLLDAYEAVEPGFKVIKESTKDLFDFIDENGNVVKGFFIALAIYVGLISAPMLLMTAAILGIGIAFGLIYDDIMAFKDGQDSLLGEAFEKWPILRDIFESMKEIFLDAKELALDLFEIIKKIFNGEYSFRELFSDAASGLGDLASDGITGLLDIGKQALFGASNNNLAAQTSNSINNAGSSVTNSNFQVGKINVDARGGDSQDIATNLDNVLREQFSKTIADFDNGIKS